MTCEPFYCDVYVILILAGNAVNTHLSSMHILRQSHSFPSLTHRMHFLLCLIAWSVKKPLNGNLADRPSCGAGA